MQPTPEFLRSLHGPSLQAFLDAPTFGTLAEAFNWEKSPQGTDFWKRAYSAALLMGSVHGNDYEIVQGFMSALEAMNKQQGQKRVICKSLMAAGRLCLMFQSKLKRARWSVCLAPTALAKQRRST